MELIYKDALLKELGITNDDCEKCAWGDGYGYCTRGSEFTDACDAICTAPTIEERKGKWEMLQMPINPLVYKCSICGKPALQTMTGCLVNRHYVACLTDYCPNCGAKMERTQP